LINNLGSVNAVNLDNLIQKDIAQENKIQDKIDEVITPI
jgi:uncharacterized protein YqfB (UPF0267 family)